MGADRRADFVCHLQHLCSKYVAAVVCQCLTPFARAWMRGRCSKVISLAIFHFHHVAVFRGFLANATLTINSSCGRRLSPLLVLYYTEKMSRRRILSLCSSSIQCVVYGTSVPYYLVHRCNWLPFCNIVTIFFNRILRTHMHHLAPHAM